MKETKSLKVLLVFILFIGFVYNVFINIMLDELTHYTFYNMFFAVTYEDKFDPTVQLMLPQFFNWLLLVSFIFISVMLIIRILINKDMKVERARK